MRHALAGAVALTLSFTITVATVAAPVPAHAEEYTGQPPSPYIEPLRADLEWVSFVDLYAAEHGITYERAEDKIDAWFRCLGGIVCRPEIEQWRRIAADAGWVDADWPIVACLIRRESGGNERAVYRGTRRRPEHSVGLLQLNTRGSLLARFGGLSREELLDPFLNLVEGRRLFVAEGFRPWGGRCRG